MGFLNNILYFLLAIGILVFIHELGHFLAAKLSGMRVERFSIGFPPRAFGKKVGDTDYCVSWIPIGGYVKIAGMIDESFDTEFLNKEPQPWEFRAKPYYQRIFVITAGVLMNVLLAVAIFWAINFVRGKIYRQTTEVSYVVEKSPADNAGFKAGDKILAVNGKKIPYWEEFYSLVYLENIGDDVVIDVERDNHPVSISALRKSIPDAPEEDFGLVAKHTVAIITAVEPNRPAARLGLQPKDTIVALNETRVFYAHQVVGIISSHAGKEVSIEFKRGDQRVKQTVIPDPDGRIGIQIAGGYFGPTVHTRYNLIGALPEGLNDVKKTSIVICTSVWQIITGKVSLPKSVAGPIRIAQMATTSAEGGVMNFLNFVALLSMSLAILNILPFPALDGGHLVFLLIEAVFRREIPHRVKIALQQVGFILLLAFMAFVIYNDIVHF
jgi:regulator of sigma E protease